MIRYEENEVLAKKITHKGYEVWILFCQEATRHNYFKRVSVFRIMIRYNKRLWHKRVTVTDEFMAYCTDIPLWEFLAHSALSSIRKAAKEKTNKSKQ